MSQLEDNLKHFSRLYLFIFYSQLQKIIEKTLFFLGFFNVLRKALEFFGNALEDSLGMPWGGFGASWGGLGESLGRPWEVLGTPWERLGEDLGTPWDELPWMKGFPWGKLLGRPPRDVGMRSALR